MPRAVSCRVVSPRPRCQSDLELAELNAARAAAGQRPVLSYRHVYCPARGMFRELRREELALGSFLQVRLRVCGLCVKGWWYRVAAWAGAGAGWQLCRYALVQLRG